MPRKPTILIVEDERIAAEDLRVTLEGSGFEVVGMASTGEEALARAEARPPDLALMDIVLKGPMNGIGTAMELRRRHDIPVIYITAYSDPDTVSRIKESEPYGYIHKPFDFRELQIVIETALIKHRIERTLREREEWFSTTLRSIGDGVIAADPKGAVTFMNATAECLTGWTLEEARGMPVDRVFRIVNEQTRRAAENPVRRVLREGRVMGLANHTILLRRDGAPVSIDDSGAPILNGRGEITGAVLVFKDITEKKSYERILYDSENRYRQLVETSPDAIMLIDPDGTIKWVNRRAARLFGHASPARIVGSSAVNLVAPESLEPAREGIRILSTGATVEKAAFTFLRKNGTRFPVELSASPIRDVSGKLQAIITVTRDVSDRQKASGHIHSLSRFPEENPNPVLRADGSGRVLYANPAGGELLAFWKTGEGKRVPSKVRKKIIEVKSRKSVSTMEIDAGMKVYSLDIVPVAGESYINLYGRDVTLQKQVESLKGQHLHAQTVLAGVSNLFMDVDTCERLYEPLARLVMKESGADHITVSEYDSERGGLRMVTSLGLDKLVKSAGKRSGLDLRGMRIPVDAYAEDRVAAYKSRRLIPVNDGFFELSAGFISRKRAGELQRDLGVKDMWVMGLCSRGNLLGRISLFFKSSGTLRNRNLVESIVNQASLMIQHLRLEQSLRQAESVFRKMAEAAQDGFWSLDEGFVTRFVNAATAKALGFRIREMIGRPLSDFLPKKDFEYLLRLIKTVRPRKTAETEFLFLCKNGITKRISVKIASGNQVTDGSSRSFVLMLKG